MSARAKKLNALAALKAKRDGIPLSQTKNATSDSDDDAIYDEVSEDEYRSIVRGRMMEDDFIEDDDGSGYVDHGQDEWEKRGGGGYSDDDTEDEQDYFERTGRKKPKKGTKARAKADSKAYAAKGSSSKSSLSAAFNKQALRPPSLGGIGAASSSSASRSNAMDAYRPAVSREKEEDFMARLMGNLEDSNAGAGAHNGEPASPSPAARATSSLARKRKQDDYESTFGRFRTSKLGSGGFSSPSTGPATSDSLHPSSDGVAPPSVHVTGSDTPPWGPNLGSDPPFDLDEEAPSSKKARSAKSLPRRIGSLGLDADEDKDIFVDQRRRAEGVDDKVLAISDDDDEGGANDGDLSIRKVVVGKAPVKAVNLLGQKAQPKPAPTPKAARTKLEDDETTPKPAGKPSMSNGDKAKTPTSHWKAVHSSLLKNATTAGPDVASPSTANYAGPSTPKAGASNSHLAAGKIRAFEDDGSTLHFYWLDYLEGENSVVYLVGKIKDRETGRYVSCCLTVNGIERCVFLLPREKQLENGHVTDRTVGEEDVYDEFEELSAKHGVQRFLSKWVTRKYAFEQAGVPSESHYLKVRYGFDEPQLPFDFRGRTFSKAFGTNTSPFELLVVKRRIFGPCWLKVRNAGLSEGTPVSWCKLEVSVEDPKDISPVLDTDATAPKEMPPLTVMSLSTRSVVNHKENKRELVTVSARTWHDHQIEDPTPPENLPCSIYTAVRPLGSMFPPGFEAEAKKGKTKVHTLKYERMLLNSLLAQIQLTDPDVIVGHEFGGVSLDVLLHRMKELRADHWSRIGRFRRPKWPTLKQGMNLKILAGRLVCDLTSDNAKSMITSTTWSLTEMCGTQLGIQRDDIDPDETASYFDSLAPSPERLMTFVRHCEVDTFFQMAIAAKVQILPLTKQLTNLAGNSWNKTLNGGRAERNEYILLHDFHRQKYICPDKITLWEKKQIAEVAAAKKARARKQAGVSGADEAAAAAATSSKKDKFKGGLVFEPKRGLWDKFILVMDFNSLYPSIIQEFNIDFTTVQRPPTQGLDDANDDGAGAKAASPDASSSAAAADVDQIPDVPSSDVEQGVLPRIIAGLVQRRRQVKSLMKDRTAKPSQLMQWNIKQLALKLTANSMYGCLGFENSRFYARPLAALTTYKGREILTATKELAESMLLDVIYGDTDSVMINTNATEYHEAIRIGLEFKKAVNERYRLLEIDIDGVFERMLLLQKKKYAAVLVDESGRKTTEVKGLDMKRREYSALSKNVSNYVLSQILSGNATETVVEQIHEYLSEVGHQVRAGQVAIDDFIIYKRLGKNPEDYPDSKSQPHVQVALRMKAKGGSARMGDVIPYIFCLGEDGSSSSKTAQADRAYHPDEVRKKESELRVDYEYYLALQILPPVERLCDSIEGTDRSRLAECLGLDPSKYVSVTSGGAGGGAGAEREFVTLDSQIPDEVRFAECKPLVLRCAACREASMFYGPLHTPKKAADGTGPVANEANVIGRDGIRCRRAECGERLPLASVVIQLELAIRGYIGRYYAGWTECNEASCGAKTRMASVYARRCVAMRDVNRPSVEADEVSGGGVHGAATCKGRTEQVYRDKQLYNQLLYLESLVDAERIRERAKALVVRGKEDEVLATLDTNAGELRTMKEAVAKYLEKNGRRYVKLSALFRFMKV
ncbi:DNA-directed DNA polymerase alpha catalytic subunit pol1 [Thecaphora frezii]